MCVGGMATVPVAFQLCGLLLWRRHHNMHVVLTCLLGCTVSAAPCCSSCRRGDLTNISPLFDAGVTLELRPDGYPRSLPEGVIAHKLVLRNVQTRAMPGR